MEESGLKDVYARVYEAARPELFFKAAGWRVVGPGGDVAIRPDSSWDVPEPELAVLGNSRGEVVAFSCGNDMSSRSIEGENPLYLPQAKVYDGSCSLGPGAVPAWEVDLRGEAVRLEIERAGARVFSGEVSLEQMVGKPAELLRSLLRFYACPAGVWLLTGTGIVPDPPYSAEEGDVVRVAIEGLGTLVNRVTKLPDPSPVG